MLDVVISMSSPFLFDCSSDFFDVLFPAIIYLESKQKLHCDISYTNILLQNPVADSTPKAEIQKEITEALGLSNIEKCQKDLNCQEGLLIDCDYMASMPEATSQIFD